MNDTIRTQISAFVDGELPSNESELLLRRLSQDGEFREVVESYFAIGRYMRRDVEVPNMAQLRGRIAAELGEELPALKVADIAVNKKYVKPIAGLAVAASVAMLAIFSLQQIDAPAVPNEPVVAYTQPSANQLLDEMFRHHESSWAGAASNAILTELVSLEINTEKLVRVESRARSLSPVAADDNVPETRSGTVSAESQKD